MQTLPSTRDTRKFLARPLLVAVCLLQLTHVFVVCFLPHAALASNILQFIFPFLTFLVSLRQSTFSTNGVGRRCWLALATAFGIWAAAQGLFIYFLYFPPAYRPVRADDALWLLFGLPLLLAMNMAHDELDKVGLLDRAQAILFVAVLYLLVFLPSRPLRVQNAYLIQNVALILCCFLRLPVCTRVRERRFFTRLALFLLAYGVLETIGGSLYGRGWQAGSALDLIWTLPVSLLLVLILLDVMQEGNFAQEPPASRLLKAARSMQGLNVAALAFLAMGVSGVLAMRQPLIGGTFVVAAFTLFAFRIEIRERAWHYAHRRLEETALQDTLTGLGNRKLLRNSLEDRLANAEALSTVLIFTDLDHFKTINDSLGHAVGDQLLIRVTQRLRAKAPFGSVLCRLGGDEFVVLTSAANAADAFAIGTGLSEALRVPYDVHGRVVRCTASLGVVLAMPGESADTLLRTADHAMYRAKQRGKDCVQLFDTSLRDQMSFRWQMEANLRSCLERDGIDVAFQPILSVEGGVISGFEALARWSHPQHGSVAPCDFIPLAEESGLILLLGAQVLEKACRQVASWNRSWGTRLSVSVNVSPRQFTDVNLLSQVLHILEKTGFDPRLLRLEITESALLVHQDTVKQILTEARKHGIRISLDDFGTGYSSLAFLLNLPVDEVKVDRSFVSDMHNDPQRMEVVRTVVHLGQSLGKRVVAEGVETEQDLRELAAMGCECAQGWLISKPLLADALEASLPAIQARSAMSVHAPLGSFGAKPNAQVQRQITSRPKGALTSVASLEPTL